MELIFMQSRLQIMHVSGLCDIISQRFRRDNDLGVEIQKIKCSE